MITVLRQADENDLSFIFSSWLKSYRNQQKFVSSEIYFEGQHKLIELILRESHCIVICPVDDPDSIIGYVVYKDNAMHWIYVKSVFRNLGMARKLLTVFENGEPTSYSHFSAAVHFLLSDDCIFNPYSYLENT
jgi:hypothetical protein